MQNQKIKISAFPQGVYLEIFVGSKVIKLVSNLNISLRQTGFFVLFCFLREKKGFCCLFLEHIIGLHHQTVRSTISSSL